MNLDSLIRAVQKSLGAEVDGKPGPETWAAIYNKIVREPAGKPEAEPGQLLNHKVDERSERIISSLLPEVHPYARALVTRAAAGIQIKIISGTRTYAEQEALYAQGRTPLSTSPAIGGKLARTRNARTVTGTRGRGCASVRLKITYGE